MLRQTLMFNQMQMQLRILKRRVEIAIELKEAMAENQRKINEAKLQSAKARREILRMQLRQKAVNK